MEKTAFQIRPLAPEDLSFDLLHSFVRTQVVQMHGGGKMGNGRLFPHPLSTIGARAIAACW